MTDDSWDLHFTGTTGEPERDRVIVCREGNGRRILLEVDAPGIRSGTDDQDAAAHQAIQGALEALKEVLDSSSGLPLRR